MFVPTSANRLECNLSARQCDSPPSHLRQDNCLRDHFEDFKIGFLHRTDTLRGHPEASEALDLSQTMAGILSPPNMRQQPSTAPVSRPISRTGLLPERMHDRPEAYPFRQPLPPAQLPAGSHGPGNTPPTRYRLLVPVQLVSPLLGPGGGIDECVKAYDGAMITFSNSMLGELLSAPLRCRVPAVRGSHRNMQKAASSA